MKSDLKCSKLKAFWDAEAAVTQGGSNRVQGNGNLEKSCYQCCLLLFSNNIDLKIISINFRKPF